MRRAELAALELGDYEPLSGSLAVRSGKGRKDRLLYAAGGAEAALADWLALRGEMSGPLFVPISRGGRLRLGRRLSGQAIAWILERRAEEAAVGEFSPHDLRRTFIGDLLDAGADLATVQRLAGHSSPATTSRYDRRGEESKRRAVSLLHVPYASARRQVR
jgi:site-specific recombinase XerD